MKAMLGKKPTAAVMGLVDSLKSKTKTIKLTFLSSLYDKK